MLDQEDYEDRWKKKLAFYAESKIERWSEKTPGGRLIVTEDGPKKGLDTPRFSGLIERLWGR